MRDPPILPQLRVQLEEETVASSTALEPPERHDSMVVGHAFRHKKLAAEHAGFKPRNAQAIAVKREPEGGSDFLDGSSSQHRGKRRCLIVEVIVPSWAEVKKKKEAYQEDLKKLKMMKNPKAKKIKNMELLPDTVRSRLKHLNLDLYPITLDRASQEVTVTRQFMSAKYGGSMQAARPEIAKKFLDVHRMNNFFYLNLDYQPEAPQVPGAHGLYFSPKRRKSMPGLQRVVTRIQGGLWQYMGMYTATQTQSLTKEEWAMQPARVRNTWAKQICLQDWGGLVMARVRFRKLMKREPSDEEAVEFYESKKHKSTTPDEVAEAYDKGEERLSVWVLQCVGYDDKFQLELCEKFPQYVPLPPKNKERGKKGGRKLSRDAVQSNHKRKRSDSLVSDAAGPESEDSEADEEYGDHLVYRHRGTRSRPIHL